jgi:hypothetical protein
MTIALNHRLICPKIISKEHDLDLRRLDANGVGDFAFDLRFEIRPVRPLHVNERKYGGTTMDQRLSCGVIATRTDLIE